jgi:type II secretory pathway pseudopilin PulG
MMVGEADTFARMSAASRSAPLVPGPSPLGFTLVETMLAALLLAAGILLVLGADRNTRLLGARSGRLQRAVEAAASMLDSARGRCPAGVPVVASPVTADAPFADGRVQVETLLACGGP